MRVKRLLVVLLLLVGFSIAGHAATPQLTNVSVAGQGNTSTVTLQTSGGFTHNEYRPADHLLLVDLVGVSAGKFDERKRTLQVPGIKSYHVVSYAGAGGVPIARIELEVEPRSEVKINPSRETLEVEISASGASVAAASTTPVAASAAESGPSSQPSATLAQPEPSTAAVPAGTGSAANVVPAASASSRPVEVTNVAVSHSAGGVVIEVSATGPLSPRTMKLKGPDRIVVDLPNAVPARVQRNVPVNASGVIAVRTGRFQTNPPVTRVVLDLSAAGDFDLSTEGNKLLVNVPPVHKAASVESAGLSNPAAAGAQLRPVAETERPLQPAAATAEKAAGEAGSTPAETNPAFAELTASQPNTKATNPSSEPTPATPDSALAADAKPAADAKSAGSGETGAAVSTSGETAAHAQTGDQTAKELVIVEPKVQDRVSEKDPNTEPSGGTAAATSATTAVAGTQNSGATPSQAGTAQSNKAINFAAEQQQASAEGSGQRYTGEPISVNLKDVDLKDFFRLIHEISGLNIVLDPSVSGSLTLVLDDVPWDQALDIVLKNNGLDRELDGNVLRIATVQTLRHEADAHRQQVEAKALAVDKITATRFLSYAHAKDVMATIKKLLSSRGDVVADERTNALIINDIPSVMPPIDRLIAQLDRKTMEVEIEARVVAATRRFAREIGAQIGFGWANNPTAVGGASGVGISPITVNTTTAVPYFTVGQSIPLFSNLPVSAPTSGLSLNNLAGAYRVDAIITAAESRGLVKILSRPRVITQNNIQAVVKQGQKVPIVTAAQLNGPPTVTYIEAVLRLQVTPQITSEGTIFLNVDIENTTPDFSNKIQGNPVFLTQQATTQVLISNGGTVVIGGVVQSQNSMNVQQVPFLGSIPMVGNLFKKRGVDTNTAELIFFITPRIVET